MARTTYTERGARIALEVATARAAQLSLWPQELDNGFWQGVYMAAHEQLIECAALRSAQESRA